MKRFFVLTAIVLLLLFGINRVSATCPPGFNTTIRTVTIGG